MHQNSRDGQADLYPPFEILMYFVIVSLRISVFYINFVLILNFFYVISHKMQHAFDLRGFRTIALKSQESVEGILNMCNLQYG